MRIGVLVSAYDCERYISQTLKPWLELRSNSKDHEFLLAASNGQWLNYKEAGIEPTFDSTGQILFDSDLDFMYRITGNMLISEEESRTFLLRYLQQNECDLIWILDGDEVWSVEEILRTIEYVQQYPDQEFFRVNFKNYTLRLPLFVNDFYRTTIYRDKVRGGIQRFFFDTDVVYGDGNIPDSLQNHIIPRDIAFPDHYTWLREDKRCFEKIKNQEHKYVNAGEKQVRCSYKIDGDDIKFNEAFWQNRGMQIPVLREFGQIYSHDLVLDFNRALNRIDIHGIKKFFNVDIVVKTADESHTFYQTNMNLEPNVSYWVMPNYSTIIEDGFKAIKVSVFYCGLLIHDEILHLNV